jgi:hypothetical protein
MMMGGKIWAPREPRSGANAEGLGCANDRFSMECLLNPGQNRLPLRARVAHHLAKGRWRAAVSGSACSLQRRPPPLARENAGFCCWLIDAAEALQACASEVFDARASDARAGKSAPDCLEVHRALERFLVSATGSFLAGLPARRRAGNP